MFSQPFKGERQQEQEQEEEEEDETHAMNRKASALNSKWTGGAGRKHQRETKQTLRPELKGERQRKNFENGELMIGSCPRTAPDASQVKCEGRIEALV